MSCKKRLLVVLLLASLLENGGSNAVEVALSVDRNATSSAGGVLLKYTDLLKALEHPTLDFWR